MQQTLSILLLTFFSAVHAFANESSDRPDNWREQCRQVMSGIYLHHYDAAKQARDFATVLVKEIEALEKSLVLDKKKLDDADKKNRTSEFEKKLAIDVYEAKQRVENIESSLASKKEALIQAKKVEAQQSSDLKHFEKIIAPVFKIEEKTKETVAGYQFRLNFKAECPRFRAVCPLPAVQSAALLKLVAEMEDTMACERYAGIKD
jgi:hypothetical protein